jgi:predicted 2-oxoglutarate/Fe(II)-dependent dioxygenase YbiX
MRKDTILDDDLFVLHDFLSPDECAGLIATAEAAGFADAPINTLFGAAVRKDVRDNDRVMIDDGPLAAAWYERARAVLPARLGWWEPCGLNERLRFYRYAPGQRFDWHLDGAFHRANGEASRLTFMVYLNGGVAGGCTAFNLRREGVLRESDPLVRVLPAAGKALVFRHDLLHTGEAVLAGTKYVVRSDVMCRRAGD